MNLGTATVTDIQAAMRPDEALIATYLGEGRAYAWAVPHRGPVTFHTIDKGRYEIASEISSIRDALDADVRTLGDIPPFDLDMAHELYRSFLKPIEPGWRDARSLYVVADGPLGQLPISLLPTEPASPGEDKALLFDHYRNVPWLARTHAVTVLPSARSLLVLRSTPDGSEARRSFVGFGDPWFGGEPTAGNAPGARRGVALDRPGDQLPLAMEIGLRSTPGTRAVDSAGLSQLPRLPDTADEIKGIGAALKADLARDIFIGKQASEARVKTMNLSDRKVIAFATHGLVPGDLNGLTQPALALSSPEVTGGAEDGLLTMGEILGLELDADLVVLSACNTAAAEGAGAEAVSGLGRAFFYAGSRALLVSNWPVHSASTTALTTDLFRRLVADPSLVRAEALRLAMLAMIDGGAYPLPSSGKALFSYAHPIFWAPFSLVGDGGKESRQLSGS
jgi:CHAT domain-containing protein